jgi:large subunit ribosomal protein L19
VRKVASGVGVEKIFPLYSPLIDKIEVTKRAKARRAKLYHVRKKAAKEISREMRRTRAEREVPQEAEGVQPSVDATVPESVAEQGAPDAVAADTGNSVSEEPQTESK